jgi:hypothetical protein
MSGDRMFGSLERVESVVMEVPGSDEEKCVAIDT